MKSERFTFGYAIFPELGLKRSDSDVACNHNLWKNK